VTDVTASSKSIQPADRIEQWLASGLNWIVAASLLLALALRVMAALGTYLNPDEALDHLLVNQSTLAAAYRASLTNAHPPLYYVLLYYWRFVGNSEVMLRLPSILASTAAAWMASRWIAMVLGKAAGLACLLILAFSPALTTLGAEVRPYSVLLLWEASALYFLERAFRDQKVSSIAYSSLFLYLAILTHYSALWFVVALGIYVLLRIASLKGHARIAWMLFQAGGAGIYVWLYLVHISKMRGSPMEADAQVGWLNALYFHAGETPWAFVRRTTVYAFQFLFSSEIGGIVALACFLAGALWIFGVSVSQKKRDLAAFGLLLLLPFALGLTASFFDLYPYGGTRHSLYLLLFAAAGVSFLVAGIVRQRLLPVLLLAILIIPYWDLNPLHDPQDMKRKDQLKEPMANAIAGLQTSVRPDEPVFSDYQASLLLAYYLGRDHPQPPPRECGGVAENQYGKYRVVVPNIWSASPAEMKAAMDAWRKACDSTPRDSFWVFDAGWGKNLFDAVNESAPRSISQGRQFAQFISLFTLRIDP
jgi:hypothetical protein